MGSFCYPMIFGETRLDCPDCLHMAMFGRIHHSCPTTRTHIFNSLLLCRGVRVIPAATCIIWHILMAYVPTFSLAYLLTFLTIFWSYLCTGWVHHRSPWGSAATCSRRRDGPPGRTCSLEHLRSHYLFLVKPCFNYGNEPSTKHSLYHQKTVFFFFFF